MNYRAFCRHVLRYFAFEAYLNIIIDWPPKHVPLSTDLPPPVLAGEPSIAASCLINTPTSGPQRTPNIRGDRVRPWVIDIVESVVREGLTWALEVDASLGKITRMLFHCR